MSTGTTRPTGPRAIKPGCVWPRLLADADAHTRDLDSITREGAAVVGPPLRDLYELTPTGVLRLIPQPRPGTPAGTA